MKRIGMIVTLALLLVACSKDTTDKVQNDIDVADKTFTMGEEVVTEEIAVQITDANFSSTKDAKAPNNGKVLSLELKISNQTNEEDILVDNLDFTLTDKSGKEMEVYYGYEENDIHGVIAPQETIEGKLFYDVNDSGIYELTYQPAIHGQETTVSFEVEVKDK